MYNRFYQCREILYSSLACLFVSFATLGVTFIMNGTISTDLPVLVASPVVGKLLPDPPVQLVQGHLLPGDVGVVVVHHDGGGGGGVNVGDVGDDGDFTQWKPWPDI